jgi:hypothetical protein
MCRHSRIAACVRQRQVSWGCRDAITARSNGEVHPQDQDLGGDRRTADARHCPSRDGREHDWEEAAERSRIAGDERNTEPVIARGRGQRNGHACRHRDCDGSGSGVEGEEES